MANKIPEVQIEYRSISELEKLGGNPRYIKEDDMAKLKQSIQDNPDYFECRPIILSDRTGSLVIIAGNMRYEAAKLVGLKEVPTVLLHNLSENREKEIVIRDNVANGRWDFDILASDYNVEELEDWGVNVDFLKDDEWGNLPDVEGEVADPNLLKPIKLVVAIPNEMEDKKSEIRNALESVLKEYEGVKLQ